MMNELPLDYLFHPRSVAIAGVSNDMAKKYSAGRDYMQALIDCGYQGRIYPINPGGGEVFGSKIYTSISDVPGTVDYVISAVRARHVTRLVADCPAKGVKAIHFFTSGFSEVEDDKGGELEQELLGLARRGGVRILGPNCMGIYCPATGLSFALNFSGQEGFPRLSGPVGFFAQSGGNSIHCIREANTRGVYFSKAVSYGNASDLNESDFLEYFADDPETRVITAYIEGVKDGSRFIRVLNQAAARKPVIVCKAGNSETGTRAAASHTGSIAGSGSVWKGLLKQAGAIQVRSIEEIVDVAVSLLRMAPPRGKNAALIGSGGGASVMAADDCADAGLALPLLPTEVRRQLRNIYGSEAGAIFRNPVDIPAFAEVETTIKAIATIAHCDMVDVLILQMPYDIWGLVNKKEATQAFFEAIIRLRGAVEKPVAVVLHALATPRAYELAMEAQSQLTDAGFPVYFSVRQAASAISKLVDYAQWHSRRSLR